MLGSIPMYTVLPARDLDEAKNFYSQTLGMHIIDENSHGVWYQAGSSRFAIYQSPFAGTNKATSAIWEVEDPEATVRSLRARGVNFEHYDDPHMKREGDIHTSRGLKAAWFKDPSGNIICIGTPL